MALDLTKTTSIGDMMHRYEELKNAGHISNNSLDPPYMGPKFNPQTYKPSLNHMIASRLRLHEGEHIGFDHMHAHQLTPDKFVVFLVVRGEPMMIADGALFPSDCLITKLKLLSR